MTQQLRTIDRMCTHQAYLNLTSHLQLSGCLAEEAQSDGTSPKTLLSCQQSGLTSSRQKIRSRLSICQVYCIGP